jgi:2-polyprenyl-3-methyl-5-hydroxy-6-metoxy-1,4-benzoquinol methylase
MHPKELSDKAKTFSVNLNMVDRLLMTWRPRICPYHILMEYIPQGSSVLDIGCGMGLWLLLLSRLGRLSKGVGVEIDGKKIKIANSIKIPADNLEFLQSGGKDKWPAGSYDCVTMIDVLHHILPNQQEAFLAKIKEIDTRRIVFKDIDPQAKMKCIMNLLHDMLLSRQLPRYCEKEKVAACFKQLGFTVKYIGRCDMLWYSHYVIVAEK